MGWFDESDSEDEEQTGPLHAETAPNQNDEEEEEEDPLDAYMKTLQPSQPSANVHERAERLDVHAQEEATSHWEEPTRKRNRIAEKQEEAEHEDDTNTNSTKQQQHSTVVAASLAMASTFHRAGESSRESKHLQVELKLDQVQHEQIQYSDFTKNFWNTTDTPKGHAWRSQHEVTSTLSVDPILDLPELQPIFGDGLYSHVQSKGFVKLTLVQSQTLPVALSGKDAIITAATGSGKTLAYIWPMVVHVCDQQELREEETGPIGLVLVPTRELALQVHRHAKSMLQPLGGHSVAVTGGTSKYQFVLDLKKSRGVEIVVATPGRLLDVLSVKKKNGMTLTRTTMVVLDEADKMLDMGFESQVSEILKNIRPDRQSLLLSATMGRKVERVAKKWLLRDAVRIAVGRTGQASEHVDQHVMVLPSYQAKRDWFLEMVPVLQQVGRTLVFVAKRDDCETLAAQIRGDRVFTLHGDKHQSDRNAALRAFKAGSSSVLIATDVAARGLDVPNVSTVVNFDVAKNLDSHVHRIGRAGRLDKEQQNRGTAYTLLGPKNADFAFILLQAFEREGREASPELRALANKSRRAGNVSSRTKWNKSGLGFDDHDPSAVEQNGNHTNYYGPSTSAPPPSKRSRWE